MSTQFTPGPWQFEGSHIYAPDGAIIAQVRNPGSRETDYPLVANRNLMAAAPDLYTALESIASFKGKTLLGPEWDTDHFYDKGANAAFEECAALALQALAKARGEL